MAGVKNTTQTRLEATSKIWIRFESKAQVGKKAEHTREYVSILSRPVTPLSDLRRVFELVSSPYVSIPYLLSLLYRVPRLISSKRAASFLFPWHSRIAVLMRFLSFLGKEYPVDATGEARIF